jgi:tol-pal system protein YbgF
MRNRNKSAAAIIIMAAFVLVSGCAMKRDVMRVEEKIDLVRSDQQRTMELIVKLDSLLSADSDESGRLRAEIRSALNDLTEQLRIMQANFNDLQDKVNVIPSNPVTYPAVGPTTGPTDSGKVATTPPAGIDCQALYDDSYISLRRGQYEDAIRSFNDYLKNCGSHGLVPDARFFIGESYYSMNKYKEAMPEFETILKDYPESEKCPLAMFKIARCQRALNQPKDAKATLQNLIKKYPNSYITTQAKEELKDIK